VLTSPLPATLAGGLTPRFRRGFRIRVGTRGISSGSVAAFRHRRSPPDLLLPEPRRLPFGRPLGILRVFPKVPRSTLRHHPGIEVSLAFSLNPAPFGLRFGVRAIPAVLARVFGFYPRGFSPQTRVSLRFLPGSLRPAYRSAKRVATSPSILPARVVRLSPFRASGCARTVLRYFPQGLAGACLYTPVFGRFLSIPSG